MLKLCVYVLKYYITIKKNEVELYILKGLQDFLCYSKASCRPCIIWSAAAGAAAKSLQSCLALCDPIDGSPPGSPIPRILQARVLEWGAMAFSRFLVLADIKLPRWDQLACRICETLKNWFSWGSADSST